MTRTRREAIGHSTILRELEVVRTEILGPAMLRVTLGGEQLLGVDVADHDGNAVRLPGFASLGFDDHVKLLVPLDSQTRPPLPVQGVDRLEWGAAGGRPVAKDYTPRRFDAAKAELDIDFVRHGTGFAAQWAELARPGDQAWIVGPTRSLALPEGIDTMFLAGDETALPAMARLLEQWPSGLPGRVVIDIASDENRLDLEVPPSVELTWTVGAEAWREHIVGLDWPTGDVFCWVAGETTSIRPIRSHLTSERQVPRDLLDVTGYWRRS